MLTNKDITGLSIGLLNAYWRIVEVRLNYWRKRGAAGNTIASAKADALAVELAAIYAELERRTVMLPTHAVFFFIHTGIKFKIETI